MTFVIMSTVNLVVSVAMALHWIHVCCYPYSKASFKSLKLLTDGSSRFLFIQYLNVYFITPSNNLFKLNSFDTLFGIHVIGYLKIM